MDYIFDYSKLKGRTKEQGWTQEAIAERIGISSSAYSTKINNIYEFTQNEIIAIIDCLDIPINEIPAYFFTEKVQKTKQKERTMINERIDTQG